VNLVQREKLRKLEKAFERNQMILRILKDFRKLSKLSKDKRIHEA
jgi:hypothetical protein